MPVIGRARAATIDVSTTFVNVAAILIADMIATSITGATSAEAFVADSHPIRAGNHCQSLAQVGGDSGSGSRDPLTLK
jgi:hypothetical protein